MVASGGGGKVLDESYHLADELLAEEFASIPGEGLIGGSGGIVSGSATKTRSDDVAQINSGLRRRTVGGVSLDNDGIPR